MNSAIFTLKDLKLGRHLATLHKKTSEEIRPTFGFDLDGQCGAFPQLNNVEKKDLNWVEFFRNYRLQPQIDGLRNSMSARRKIVVEKLEKISDNLEDLFLDLNVERIGKSLLHGDLWSGNWGCRGKEIVMYDPAAYYGHGEADLGIISMFGDKRTIENYYEEAKITPSVYRAKRLHLYRLYHELNHTNIFGDGYLSSVETTLNELLN
eukprot:maker-scaffold_16-snap-gene-5.11-mRNA-1 protein AED:0.37 eAED:0.83 QI:183/0/0.5/1/0/0/2/0/206